NVPVRVGLASDTYTGVAAGFLHVLAIRAAPGSPSGRLYGFGLNNNGQLGRGMTSNREALGEVEVAAGTTATDWTGVSAGTSGSFGLRGDSLYSWGGNNVGELGLSGGD